MKKKISIIVGVVVLLAILGFVVFKSFETKPIALQKDQPMFGASSYKQYVLSRSPEMKNEDETFIASTTKNQSINDAVKAIAEDAWIAVSKDEFDTAMIKFNQVWLLDQNNFNVPWGYGAILANQNNLQKSADYFDKAIASYSENKALVPNDYLSLWDDASVNFLNLSDTYQKTDPVKAKIYASKALKLLTDSLLQLDKLPKNIIPQEMFLLAVANFNNGDYGQARGTYNDAVNQYPGISKDNSAVLLNQELKDKGF